MADEDTRKTQPIDSQKLDDPDHKSVNQEQPPDRPSHMNQGRQPMTPQPENDPSKKKTA